MKPYRIGILATLLPALLQGQVMVRDEPYSVVPAGFEYTVEHLTPDQCPEIGSPFSMTRSRQGFLWLGTLSGIARFDGYESKIYLDDPAEPTAPLTNQASIMVEDPAGVLWIATPGDLKRLDPGSGRFVHYRNDPHDSSSIPPGSVCAICRDRYGTIWIGTGMGVVARLDRSTSKFTRYALGPSLQYAGVSPPFSHSLRTPPARSGQMRRRGSSRTTGRLIDSSKWNGWLRISVASGRAPSIR